MVVRPEPRAIFFVPWKVRKAQAGSAWRRAEQWACTATSPSARSEVRATPPARRPPPFLPRGGEEGEDGDEVCCFFVEEEEEEEEGRGAPRADSGTPLPRRRGLRRAVGGGAVGRGVGPEAAARERPHRARRWVLRLASRPFGGSLPRQGASTRSVGATTAGPWSAARTTAASASGRCTARCGQCGPRSTATTSSCVLPVPPPPLQDKTRPRHARTARSCRTARRGAW